MRMTIVLVAALRWSAASGRAPAGPNAADANVAAEANAATADANAAAAA